MLIPLLAAALAAIHPAADTSRVLHLDQRYPEFIHVDTASYEGELAFGVNVGTLRAGDPLAPLVNSNNRFFSYLAQHGASVDMSRFVATSRDPRTVPAGYAALLQRDSAFNTVMARVVGQALAPAGVRVAGYDAARPLPRLTMDEVMSVAVRFFYPDDIRPDGYIQTHVCIGLNGVEDLQRPRDVVLEAFIFSTVMPAILDDSSAVSREYRRAKEQMNRADLSSDRAVRLTRAQGLMWALMAQSGALREVLWASYREHAAMLPFVIAGPEMAAT
ncbi:MAG TPA: hypothetical protein VFJ16_05130 [Longimicrobium sp.]|nr:hypothetical protein [Longimicrobium sp.]